MRHLSSRLVAALIATAAMVLPARHASAQTPTSPPPPIGSVVSAGDTVWVTSSDGVVRRGVVFALTPAALELLVARQKHAIPIGQIRRIDEEYRDRLGDGIKRGIIVGLIAGAAFGLIGPLSACGDNGILNFCTAEGFLVFGGIFGGLGAGIGAATGLIADSARPSIRQVWSASAPRPFAVGPIVAPGRAGVRVAFRW